MLSGPIAPESIPPEPKIIAIIPMIFGHLGFGAALGAVEPIEDRTYFLRT